MNNHTLDWTECQLARLALWTAAETLDFAAKHERRGTRAHTSLREVLSLQEWVLNLHEEAHPEVILFALRVAAAELEADDGFPAKVEELHRFIDLLSR